MEFLLTLCPNIELEPPLSTKTDVLARDKAYAGQMEVLVASIRRFSETHGR